MLVEGDNAPGTKRLWGFNVHVARDGQISFDNRMTSTQQQTLQRLKTQDLRRVCDM
ncbi:MAG: hypothetical protein ACK5JT_01740 [Hyphomicrobiaceae bacterium]